MSICLSHLSADRILEALALEGRELEPASVKDKHTFTANPQEIDALVNDEFALTGEAIDVLVFDSTLARQLPDVNVHVWQAPLPEGALKCIDEGLYISSPEFCLLQQANELHLVKLCQMLGRYLSTKVPRIQDDGSTKYIDRKPLTSEESLSAFLRAVGSVKGSAALKEAMRWTCPGAASPQEVNLQLVMTLPPCYGGFGLKKPVMNYEVELSPKARELYDREVIRIDLCWPAVHEGLEYQGKEHGSQLGADYARCLAADLHGYRLWYVAAEQLASPAQLDYLARKLARRLRKNLKFAAWPSLEDVGKLLKILGGGATTRQRKLKPWRRPRKPSNKPPET